MTDICAAVRDVNTNCFLGVAADGEDGKEQHWDTSCGAYLSAYLATSDAVRFEPDFTGAEGSPFQFGVAYLSGCANSFEVLGAQARLAAFLPDVIYVQRTIKDAG